MKCRSGVRRITSRSVSHSRFVYFKPMASLEKSLLRINCSLYLNIANATLNIKVDSSTSENITSRMRTDVYDIAKKKTLFNLNQSSVVNYWADILPPWAQSR